MGVCTIDQVVCRSCCLQVGSIPAAERIRIKSIIDAGMLDQACITTDMFDTVQKVVFKEMFYNTFQRFVDTPEYVQMHEDIKNTYNKVGGMSAPGWKTAHRAVNIVL